MEQFKVTSLFNKEISTVGIYNLCIDRNTGYVKWVPDLYRSTVFNINSIEYVDDVMTISALKLLFDQYPRLEFTRVDA